MVCSVAPAGPAGYYLNDRLAASRTWQGPPHQVWLSSIPALEVHEGDALDPRLFTQLARGRRPDGKPLDRRLRQGGRTRWAIDAVFGAPKSLSLLWLESDDRAQLEWAHHDAVVAAMQPLLASDWTARRGARRSAAAAGGLPARRRISAVGGAPIPLGRPAPAAPSFPDRYLQPGGARRRSLRRARCKSLGRGRIARRLRPTKTADLGLSR